MQIVSEQLIALFIFVATYLLLATGYRERTIAAMAGVGAIWAFGILTTEEMIGYVDMNAIGLLFGMMIIVGAMREAKFFRWLGVRIADACRWRPLRLLVVFTLATAGLSALLPNVTTVLFMVTVTIDIAEFAKLDPKPYILSEIVASNIGGTATLIGDPPNIMIASPTGFSFLEFVVNLGPISLVGLIISLLYFRRKFGKKLETDAGVRQMNTALPNMASDLASDRRLFWTSLVTLVGAVVLFSLQDIVGIYPTVVALMAAVILLFIGGPKMPEILNEVEWSTLIFFGSLFIIVGALVKTGWMTVLAQYMSLLVDEKRLLGVSTVLWVSSLVSAFIDNIPFAAAFIPVLTNLESQYGGAAVYPLWWALAAGTGLGGNGTIIGSSANVIATGLAQARGVKIGFVEFAKIGMVTLLLTTGVANLILLVRFWG